MVFLPSDNIKRSELSAIIWRINNPIFHGLNYTDLELHRSRTIPI